MLISIEIMLLSITFLILMSSLSFDDILGQTFAIYIITIAGAESAIGLGILVAFYRFISSITLYCIFYKKNITNNNITNNYNKFKRLNSYKNNKIYKINKRFKSNTYLFYILSNVNYATLGVRNYSSNNNYYNP